MLEADDDDCSTGLPCKTRGSIVNIGSIGSVAALPSSNSYVMAKHGISSLRNQRWTFANLVAFRGVRTHESRREGLC